MTAVTNVDGNFSVFGNKHFMSGVPLHIVSGFVKVTNPIKIRSFWMNENILTNTYVGKWISLPRNVILARLANYLSEMRNNDCSVPNQILVIPFQNGGNQNHIVHFGKLFKEHKGILVVKTTEGLKMFYTSLRTILD